MKWIIWLGIMPLYFGVKLGWKWLITDRHQWGLLPEGYRRALPIRLSAAAGLIAIGAYLSVGVRGYLAGRSDPSESSASPPELTSTRHSSLNTEGDPIARSSRLSA